jgi:hypothetical protein
MRHSSWTLYLVPLALPAVLLCLPGSMQSVEVGPPTGQDASTIHLETPVSLPLSGVAVELTDGPPSDSPEALYQE